MVYNIYIGQGMASNDRLLHLNRNTRCERLIDMKFNTVEINGKHYSYYAEDMGDVGYSAVCDETGDSVVLGFDFKDWCLTGEVFNEYGA